MSFEIKLQKDSFFFSLIEFANINNMLILPYIEMLVGNTVHTLLLEMENDKILSGRTSDHVYKLCHFLFLEIFFALNSVLSAVSSAIPAFFFSGGEIRFILNDILESFIFIFFGYSFSLCVACKSDILSIGLYCIFKSNLRVCL